MGNGALRCGKFFSFLFFLLTILLTIVFQGKHCRRHAIHHTTTPCPLAPTFPPLLRRWASAHYIKITHNPVAATSNPSPCTSPLPPPPPLTACKNHRNATPTRHATPTHGGRIDGGGDVAAAAGMAMVCGRDDSGSGNDGGETPVLPLCISVLYFTSMQ
ncbi:hypothetical protein EDB86DRAFT_2977418 [Lactarius hatsudake]|nr:hypothetical protein EDB86DRAFT_2977418 [Lactarius hatsudake]